MQLLTNAFCENDSPDSWAAGASWIETVILVKAISSFTKQGLSFQLSSSAYITGPAYNPVTLCLHRNPSRNLSSFRPRAWCELGEGAADLARCGMRYQVSKQSWNKQRDCFIPFSGGDKSDRMSALCCVCRMGLLFARYSGLHIMRERSLVELKGK